MASQETINAFTARLSSAGFTLASERLGGPMGSALWRFSSALIDFEVVDDHGQLSVVVGPKGEYRFFAVTWAAFLGIALPVSAEFDQQLDFGLAHLEEIERAIEGDSRVGEALEEINWSLVKQQLGLDPGMPRPGTN